MTLRDSTKAILLSAYVRYNACLRPFLRALRVWPTPAEKLAHWQDALDNTTIAWGACNDSRRRRLRDDRLPEQETAAANTFAVVQRALPTPAAAPGDAVDVWNEDEDETADADALINLEVYRDHDNNDAGLVDFGESVLPTTGAFGNPLPALFDALGDAVPDILRVASTSDLFRALVYGNALTEFIAPYFEIVAYPNQRLTESLQAGDILLRDGDGAHAHIAMLADGALVYMAETDAEVFNRERAEPGYFALVVEGGAFPHDRTDRYFRRITDATSRTSHDQVLVRLKPGRPTESPLMAESIPSNGLTWAGATADQLAFMRRVYDARVQRSIRRGGTFVADVPAAQLAPVEGRFELRTAAAASARRLFAEARQTMAREKAAGDAAAQRVTRIGLTSAYRSASHQFGLWQQYFPGYYAETQTRRLSLPGGEHGSAAVRHMVGYVGARIAAPGFSNHNNGLAMDLRNIENNAPLRNRSRPAFTRRWRRTWFYDWMTANASRFGFHENTAIDEPWHWEYRSAASGVGVGLTPARWMRIMRSPDLHTGNLVTFLVDGRTAFRAMHAAINTAVGEGHYIYLLGWWLSDDFPLIPSAGAASRRRPVPESIEALFARKSSSGVQIRAMLWDQVGRQNTAEKNRINALANGAAILDDHTFSAVRSLNVGSHHQKVLVVKGSEGLVAFCGGIDFNPDRITATGSGGSGSSSGTVGAPLHDDHCQIMGPAAFDLLDTFIRRWDAHPAHAAIDRTKGNLLGRRESRPAPIISSASPSGSRGNVAVRIARTYTPVRRPPPGTTARRERSIRDTITLGIQNARRFIYMEEQYLINMDAAALLHSALPRIHHLTILIPDSTITDMPRVWEGRLNFIRRLRSGPHASKVRIFVLSNPPSGRHTYVHAKLWIFDDELAIIGSANCNQRGWTHDSEINAVVFEDRNPGGLTFAQRLRMKLWAEHLNTVPTALIDGVASANLWTSPPAGAFVRPYNPTAGTDPISQRLISWNIIDPTAP